MGLGKQVAPVSSIHTFALWARRLGYAVGEMHGFGTVHPVHTKGSWHYDQVGGIGLAADINKNGSRERDALVRAVEVAQELGLAVIYARDGINGEAKAHQTHLHTDVGPYSHLGRSAGTPRPGGDILTHALQVAVRTSPDQVWGTDTDRRLELVRAAAVWRGHTFPQGVAETQRVVGTKDDGDWGKNSRAAHDATVAAIQQALAVDGYYRGRPDGVWASQTDGAYLAARDIRWRR